MPQKPLRPCKHPGCRVLTNRTYCEAHQPVAEDRREPSSKRGYNSRWRRESRRFLAEHPFCAQCRREGRVTPATEVDHIIPHKGDGKLFWNQGNWQALCKGCHSKKTAREDGGFGNR